MQMYKAKIIAPKMKEFITALAEKHKLNLAEPGASITLKNRGFMDLSVSVISETIVDVCHTYIQNGDVMFDPSVMFYIAPGTGNWIPIEYRLDPYIHSIAVELSEDGTIPVRYSSTILEDMVDFVEGMWVSNLQQQGWLTEGILASSSAERQPEGG